MNATWTSWPSVGLGTIAIKGSGPSCWAVVPFPLARPVITLLAPAVLAALVAISTLGGDRELVVDARLPGVLAAAVAIVLKAPLLVVVIVAAAVTASVRASPGRLCRR